MFGNKSKAAMEELQQLREKLDSTVYFLNGLEAKYQPVGAAWGEVQESRNQVVNALNQIHQNMDAAIEMSSENVVDGQALKGQLQEKCQTIIAAEDKQRQLHEDLRKFYESCMELVESNKHYTDSSKKMSEVAGELTSGNQVQKRQIEELEELGKQMGVLALNAAIEAGRLGEGGMQFVAAAEEVRVLSTRYDSSLQNLREQVYQQEQKMIAMEEEIKRLISLLKDSSVASGKLLKRSASSVETMDAIAKNHVSGELPKLQDIVTGICNGQEEVAKMQERNAMQVADAKEECNTLEQYLAEIQREMKPIFEQCKTMNKGE